MRNLYGFISRDERLRVHGYHGQRDSEGKNLIRTLQLESMERHNSKCMREGRLVGLVEYMRKKILKMNEARSNR
jgi:hypothetical protein